MVNTQSVDQELNRNASEVDLGTGLIHNGLIQPILSSKEFERLVLPILSEIGVRGFEIYFSLFMGWTATLDELLENVKSLASE